MADYPSTLVNAKFKAFFTKIPNVGVPQPKADQKWLQSHGYTSINDRGLLTVLRFLDFVDSKFVPTDKWPAFRGRDGAEVLGHAIVEAYKDLYEHIPEAHKASKDDLQHFFRSKTTSGAITVQRQVLNFMSLVALAKFNPEANGQLPTSAALPEPESQLSQVPQACVGQIAGSNGLTINLNVQLTLPETADAKMIDQIFAAMGKHLLQNS